MADSLGFDLPRFSKAIQDAPIDYVMMQNPLERVLAFTGRSIDDVINDPIARNEVIGYWRLHKQVERACEAADLERWWNGRGR